MTLITILFLYFIPSVVAVMRGHPQGLAIFILNLFLGWTLVGWVCALVWSVMTFAKPAPAN